MVGVINMQSDSSRRCRIVVVGGIRTHYIKIKALQYKIESFDSEFKKKFDIIYVNAAQHYDNALTVHIKELGVHFDYTLAHMTNDSYDILSSMFSLLGELFDKISSEGKIDYVVVMGDVATTAVAALVAVIKGIKVAHIEAGLRVMRGNGNEEYYRAISDQASTLCFAATRQDYDNLIAENYEHRAVFSGDIMYDFIKNVIPNMQGNTFTYLVNDKKYVYKPESPYVLASLHHVENLSKETVGGLFCALDEMGYNSIFIAHPRVKKFIVNNNINTLNTKIVDAIPYIDNLYAISGSRFCFTDSGGIQREAYYLNRRCVVRSDLTIWPTILQSGNNIVCSPDLDDIRNALKWADANADKDIPYNGCFGDGSAVETIFHTIYKHYYETV